MSAKIKLDTRKLEQSFRKQATQAVNNKLIEVSCPYCKNKVKIRSGFSRCPRCGKTINLSLNIKF